MKQRVILFSALLLAACGQQAGNNSQAAKGGAGTRAAAADPGFIMQPGEWETTMVMDMAAMADLPPGVTLPRPQPLTTRSCITPEEVRDARAALLGRGTNRHGVDCDYGGVTIAGGHISGTSTCRSANVEMTMTMDGTFSPTAYDMTQQMRTTVGGRTRDSTGHITGRRIGECPAGGGGK
jgi:hypothetical protein